MLNLLRKTDDLSQQTTIWYVPLTRLEDNPYQTRQRNDVDHILNLAASIVQMAPSLPDTRGLQQLPVGRLVRYADGAAEPAATYDDADAMRTLLDAGAHVVELAFGHSRRLAFLALARGAAAVFPSLAGAEQIALGDIAYAAADYASMPVLLRPLTDAEMWQHAITENSQRRDLTAIEEAIAIERARKDLGMTYDQAGRIFGKSRGAAANLVRLLQLPDAYQQAILDGKLTERQGRALLPLLKHLELFERHFPIDLTANTTAADLERQVAMRVQQHDIWLAEQERGRRTVIDSPTLVRWVDRFLAEAWGDRPIPDNPSHTNGTFWQEITRWLHDQCGATHRWIDADLKFAIKQAAERTLIRQAQAQQTTQYWTPPADERKLTPTQPELRQAFEDWLAESQPTLDQLKSIAAQSHPAQEAAMIGVLMKKCHTIVGLNALWLAELLDAEIAKQSAIPNFQSPISQSPTGRPMLEVFAAEQQPAIFDAPRLLAWKKIFSTALDEIGQWSAACGHQPEAGAAARALRVVVEKIEEDLSQ